MGRNYQDSVAWQKSFALTLDLYKLTAQWPKEEKYGLTAQSEVQQNLFLPTSLKDREGVRRKISGAFYAWLTVHLWSWRLTY